MNNLKLNSGFQSLGVILLTSFFFLTIQFNETKAQNPSQLPISSSIQYKWHEQEQIMFLCLDPCTWQGREYDNHSTPLTEINLSKLNTNQWCETAQLWGAKEILFVAKHTGGFCWWQTETTDYGITQSILKTITFNVRRGEILFNKGEIRPTDLPIRSFFGAN